MQMTIKVLHAHLTHRSDAGFSLVSTLVGIGVLGIGVSAILIGIHSSNFLKVAAVEHGDIHDASDYSLRNMDCQSTLKWGGQQAICDAVACPAGNPSAGRQVKMINACSGVIKGQPGAAAVGDYSTRVLCCKKSARVYSFMIQAARLTGRGVGAKRADALLDSNATGQWQNVLQTPVECVIPFVPPAQITVWGFGGPATDLSARDLFQPFMPGGAFSGDASLWADGNTYMQACKLAFQKRATPCDAANIQADSSRVVLDGYRSCGDNVTWFWDKSLNPPRYNYKGACSTRWQQWMDTPVICKCRGGVTAGNSTPPPGGCP